MDTIPLFRPIILIRSERGTRVVNKDRILPSRLKQQKRGSKKLLEHGKH